MSSYLTIKKNDQWVIYWDRNKIVYQSWYESLGFTNAEWRELKSSDVSYVSVAVEEDLNKRKEWFNREDKVYNDLLSSHASLKDIQLQYKSVADAKEYYEELLPVKYQIDMLYEMLDQSSKDDKWEWQLG